VANINRVVLVGNLTRDPELKALPSGTSVCELGLAVNHRRKSQQTGEWIEEPNYFRVSVFGSQADTCARFLSKGRQVAIDGRLRWRQWDTPEGQKREAVEIIAENVQFIGPRDGDGGGGGGGGGGSSERTPAAIATPAEAQPWSGGGGATDVDDDIPF
jgi:single-strand DNA-binding protein